MALYGRALALLKSVHVALNEEVGDINLDTLRIVTNGTLRVTDPVAVGSWVRVLKATSPALVNIAREINTIDAFVARRKRATLMMMKSMVLMSVTVTVLVAFSVWRVMLSNASDPVNEAIMLGMLVGCMYAFFALVKSWVIIMKERLDRFSEQGDSPVMNLLRRYKLAVADKFIVQYAAAVTTGRNMTRLLESLKRGMGDDEAQDSYSEQQKSDVCAGANRKTPDDCRWPIDPCTPPDSMPPLESAVSRYCVPMLVEIVTLLQEVKLSVDRLDQPLLWRCVARGVDGLRVLVYKENDALGTGGADGLTRESAIATLRNEVLPLLKLPAVELRSFVVPALAATALGDAEPQGSKGACWRACIDDKECKVALYDKSTQVCRKSKAYSTVEGFTYTHDPKAASSVMLRRPENERQEKQPLFVCGFASGAAKSRAQMIAPPKDAAGDFSKAGQWCKSNAECNVMADDHWWKTAPLETFETFLAGDPEDTSGGGSSPACVKATTGAVYAAGVRAGAVTTMRDQADSIASRLLTVLKRHRYQLSLDANRGFIDAELTAYYGEATYLKLSSVVDDVFGRVRDKVHTLTGSRDKYIDPDRLSSKIAALTSEEAASLRDAMAQLRTCAKAHRDNFPKYRDNMMAKMYGSLMNYTTFVMLVIFTVYMIVSYLGRRMNNLTTTDLMYRVVVSACLLTMAVIVFEMLSKKYSVTRLHNHDAIDDNGERLIGSIMASRRALAALREVTEQAEVAGTPHSSKVHIASVTAMRHVQNTIEAYDRCNFITSSVSKLPFPVAEMIMYGAIILVFLGFIVYAISSLSPLAKVDNVRRLLDARNRIKLGELTHMKEVMRIIECCAPPPMVWDLFILFAVVLLFVITWWFLWSSRDTVDDYESAIAAMDDCL